jgi:hypothetical protein
MLACSLAGWLLPQAGCNKRRGAGWLPLG